MTPAARWAAAAEIMDEVTEGMAAEKALTNWARRSRFAGSKDRAAVRDHVYDILRCWRSVAALGGGSDGRSLVLGRLRQTEQDPEAVFTGEGYALVALSPEERAAGHTPVEADAWDLPDWLYTRFINELGGDAEAAAMSLKTRAPAFLRVNVLKTNRAEAQSALADAGIESEVHSLSDTALMVTEGARRIAQSTPYLTGLVELQDVASQAVVDALPLNHGQRVLDYCAGGGGKTLAMAAHLDGPVEAYDADPRRMSDLSARADRAGVNAVQVQQPKGPYDLVLCDVPCSGSGAWRRAPENKWRLTPARLQETRTLQLQILNKAAGLVGPAGVLAYATCSILRSENEDQINAFLSGQDGWDCIEQRRFKPEVGGDGFFVAVLTRVS